MPLTKIPIIAGINDVPATTSQGQNGSFVINTINQIIDAYNAFIAPPSDGENPELQANDTHIQWKYPSASDWTDLIDLSALRGPIGVQGEAGETGSYIEMRTNATHVQWKLEVDADWIDLIALSALASQIEYSEVVGATYTLQPTDAGLFKGFSVACAVTIPPDIFPVGTQIIISQEGTGTVNITSASGVTVNNANAVISTKGQFSGVIVLYQKALNLWRAYGGIS